MTSAYAGQRSTVARTRQTAITKAFVGGVMGLLIVGLTACGVGGTSATATPTTTTTTTPTTTTATPTGTATPSSGYPIKVYFSRFPDSLNNPTSTFPVSRVSPSTAVATFAVQLLIAGPTLTERGAGYFSEFNSILTGPSSCSAPYPTGGPDFTLSLNVKGTTPATGVATLNLCRASASPGIGDDARILAELNATLKQFTNITSVVVLTQGGHCFGDESGQDRCLQ